MSLLARRNKEPEAGKEYVYHPPQVSKLPRHMRLREKLRNKCSLKYLEEEPSSEVERVSQEIEAKRRLSLMTWHRDVAYLRQELSEMETSLNESLVTNGKMKRNMMRRRETLDKLPRISEAEFKRLPLNMRPKPNKPRRDLQRAQKKRSQINARSFEVMQIKLGAGRSRYSKLPGVADHYRILTTPDPRPEIKTVRMRASIQALNPPSPVEMKKIVKKKQRKKCVLVTEVKTVHSLISAEADPQVSTEVDPHVLSEVDPQVLLEVNPHVSEEVNPHASAEVDPQEPRRIIRRTSLDDKAGRQLLLDRYAQKRRNSEDEKWTSNNEDGSWYLKQTKAAKPKVQMPDIIKKVMKSKARRFTLEERVEMLRTKFKNLITVEEEELKEAGTETQNPLVPIEEEQEKEEEEEEEQEEEEVAVDHVSDKSDIDEEEYYKNRPEFEIVCMDDVKQSRLIRGYEPAWMRLPENVNKFIFNKDEKDDIDCKQLGLPALGLPKSPYHGH